VKFLQRIAKFLSYSPSEAANPSIRRSQVPGAGPTDARKELTPHARRELVRKSRYLMKNSGVAREVVGDMAIYSTGDAIDRGELKPIKGWNKTTWVTPRRITVDILLRTSAV
jgi:hypothetical protein